MWRPWAKHQNDGVHTNYAKQLFWDHSFSYDDSAYQNPTAHSAQKVAPGAYYKNYNFLYRDCPTRPAPLAALCRALMPLL